MTETQEEDSKVIVFDDTTHHFQELVKEAFKLASNKDLPEAIKGLVDTAGEVTKSYVGKTGLSDDEAHADTAANIQISLRNFCNDYVSSAQADMEARAKGLGCIIDIGIELATLGVADPDLPFRILEDLFHSQTIQDCKQTWELLEDRSEKLTDEKFMPKKRNTKSKLTMLRIANFLLRRLSQSHHTVFCGRIMMFLAYAFPLSERSGVNLLGSHNESNVTEFETEEVYEDTERARKATLSSMQIDDAESIGKSETVEYALYSSFWGIQKYFIVKPDKAAAGCVSSIDVWQKFERSADIVLSALEAKPFSEIDLARADAARERRSNANRDEADMEMEQEVETDVAKTNSENFYCTKYLSNSRLLRLQLSDPDLRRNLMCQMLILLHELRNPELKLGAKVNKSTVKEFCQGVKKRCLKLLRSTPPDGNAFAKLVQRVIARETNWELWKDQKCVAFERETIDEAEEKEFNTVVVGRQTPKIRTTIAKNCKLWANQLKSWNTSEHSSTPALKEHMQLMLDAMDPENCIEEEYHPKHDKKYCWKGLRLFTRSQLGIMNNVVSGQFEEACTAFQKENDTEKAETDKVVVTVECEPESIGETEGETPSKNSSESNEGTSMATKSDEVEGKDKKSEDGQSEAGTREPDGQNSNQDTSSRKRKAPDSGSSGTQE